MKKIYRIKKLKELEELVKQLGKRLKPRDRLFLYGTLGAGKTLLTKYLVKSLGGKIEDVTSPTFTILHRYTVNSGGIKMVYHIDLYRLEKNRSITDINLEECLSDPHGVSIVEWAEKLPEKIKRKGYHIFIEHLPNDERVVKITYKNNPIT